MKPKTTRQTVEVEHQIWQMGTGKKPRHVFKFHSEKEDIETGSSVLILKALRRHQLPVPEVMCGPSCWDCEYHIRFSFK